MAIYKVTGSYTISFEMEVEANNVEEAEEMGYNLDFVEGSTGTLIFTEGQEATLIADGEVFNVDVECLNDKKEEDK